MRERIEVRVEAVLADLIPEYLANRRADVERLRAALASGDFDAVAAIAHPIKGSGGGYGFDFISEAGRGIEQAAKEGDAPMVGQWIGELNDYLGRVSVVYVD